MKNIYSISQEERIEVNEILINCRNEEEAYERLQQLVIVETILVKTIIGEYFWHLDSCRFEEATHKFNSRSIVIFISSIHGTKFQIYWKSSGIQQFLMLKIFNRNISINDKNVWEFAADFLVNSLKKEYLGIQDGYKFRDKILEVELDELVDSRGYNLLLIACEAGESRPIQGLLRYGLPPKLSSNDQDTAQNLAQQGKHSNVVLALLQENLEFPQKFDINDCSDELKKFVEMSVKFHEMIRAKNVEKLNEIIAEHPNLRHFFNLSNESALKVALSLKLFDVYEFLVSKGISFGSSEDPESIWKGLSQQEKVRIRVINFMNIRPVSKKHIDILMENSFIPYDEMDDNSKKLIMMRAYHSLSEIPVIENILKLVASIQDFKIIFDFSYDSTYRIDPTSNHEMVSTFDFPDRVVVGAKGLLDKETETKIYGVIIHELFHLALLVVYKNKSNPYKSNDQDAEEKFFRILEICKQKKHKEKIISSVYDFYPKDHHPSELIVRTAQLIVTYRHYQEYLKKIIDTFHELFDYFYNFTIRDVSTQLSDIEKGKSNDDNNSHEDASKKDCGDDIASDTIDSSASFKTFMKGVNENFEHLNLMLFITPLKYPSVIFTHDTVCAIKMKILSIIDEIQEGEFIPRFATNEWNNGVWIVECVNTETRAWLIRHISVITFAGDPLIITSPNMQSNIQFKAVVPRKYAKYDILNRLCLENRGLVTTHWTVLNEKHQEEVTLFTFKVDDLSAVFIQSMKNIINLGNEKVFLDSGHVKYRNEYDVLQVTK